MRNGLFATPLVAFLVLVFAGFEPAQAESITKPKPKTPLLSEPSKR